jgi:hypothetical protein
LKYNNIGSNYVTPKQVPMPNFASLCQLVPTLLADKV